MPTPDFGGAAIVSAFAAFVTAFAKLLATLIEPHLSPFPPSSPTFRVISYEVKSGMATATLGVRLASAGDVRTDHFNLVYTVDGGFPTTLALPLAAAVAATPDADLPKITAPVGSTIVATAFPVAADGAVGVNGSPATTYVVVDTRPLAAPGAPGFTVISIA